MSFFAKASFSESGFSEGIQKQIEHLKNIELSDAEAKVAVLDMNAIVNFVPTNPKSYLKIAKGRVELGSTKPAYFKLLRLPSKRLYNIYTKQK